MGKVLRIVESLVLTDPCPACAGPSEWLYQLVVLLADTAAETHPRLTIRCPACEETDPSPARGPERGAGGLTRLRPPLGAARALLARLGRT